MQGRIKRSRTTTHRLLVAVGYTVAVMAGGMIAQVLGLPAPNWLPSSVQASLGGQGQVGWQTPLPSSDQAEPRESEGMKILQALAR